ncbi:MAG: T-protein [Deltaproteobacteria bacterium ADurb.Bin510]|nr:MAG: T-protein [Deltaproteobacteria bacterium ADurb.Bin510]
MVGRRTELSYAQAASRAQAVIVNVPIEHAENVIREIGPLLTAQQLLIDNTGVKSQVIETMLKSTAAEVLSIHTMFGPHVRDLKGENIIVIHTARSGQMAEEFENVLHKHGATLTVTTAAEHDRLATLTQGLEHVISAARMAVIQELAGGPEALTPFSTPNSRLSMLVDGRIHGGSAELYATMLGQNRAALATLKAFGAQIDAIIAGLECGDSSRLAELLKANRARLTDEFVERGTLLTGQLQDKLRD